jgi:hypothetical protein
MRRTRRSRCCQTCVLESVLELVGATERKKTISAVRRGELADFVAYC